MKKLILTVLLLNFYVANGQHLDSIVFYKLNFLDQFEPYTKRIYEDNEFEKNEIFQTHDGIWKNTTKYYKKYDNKNRILEDKTYKWNSGWKIDYESITAYTDSSRDNKVFTYQDGTQKGVVRTVDFYFGDYLSETQQLQWLFGMWVGQNMYWYYYENDDLIQKVHFKYDLDSLKYTRFWLNDDYYDQNHNIMIKYEYARVKNEWQLRLKNEFTYQNGLLNKSIKQVTYSELPLNPSEKIEYYEHDSGKRPNVLVKYNWNLTNKNWLLGSVDTVRFDNWSNQTVRASRAWNDKYGYFDKGVKDVSVFNENGELVKLTTYDWNGFSEKWYIKTGSINYDYGDSIESIYYSNGEISSRSMSYYQNGFIIKSYSYEYDNALKLWRHNRTLKYYYSGLTSTENIVVNDILVYPNPTSGILWVKNGPADICIFNSSGVQLLEIKNAQEIDISNLPSGLYLFKTNNKTSKIIKN